MDKIQELKRDVSELESLMAQATRTKVKDMISIDCRKLVTEIIRIEEQLKKEQQSTATTPTASAPAASTTSKRYQIRLNNYAWHQSKKLVQFYVHLKNVQSLQPEAVTCTFTPKSVELSVIDLDGRDYIFTINKLLENITPAGSSWKAKTDMVVINLAKETPVSWSHVTETEKKASEAKKVPQMDKNADPSDGLMSIMKNMYEQGDDEMKRTIAKAWTEGQGKQRGGML